MDRWKSRGGKSHIREIETEKRSEKRKVRRKMQAREKWKRRETLCFSQCFVAPEGQSRLAKAAGAEPSGEMRDEKVARGCGAEQISKSKCAKHVTAGALLEAEKKLKVSDHFWK